MAQPQRLAPGPAGTSCMTCRRRHKKCDLRRPVCERCEKGGYDCLGYSYNKQSGASLKTPASCGQSLNESRQERTAAPVLEYEDAVPLFPSSYSSSAVLPELSLDNQLIFTQRYNGHDVYLGSGTSATLDFPSRFATPPPDKRLTSPTRPMLDLSYSTQIPYQPYHLSKTLLDSSNLEDYVMAYCNRTVELTCFKPAEIQMTQYRRLVLIQLRASSFARWIAFLTAKILEALIEGDSSKNETYNLWINQMDQVLRAAVTENITSKVIQDLLRNQLQILLLKTLVMHSSNIHQILRKATSTFLQIVYSDPTLWSSDCDPTSVPLANVSTSARHELAYFSLVDITAAMAFGLPQQVEYNTLLEGRPDASLPYECVHSSPIEFQIALAEINACRDKSPNARNWEQIEHKLTAWQPRPSEHDPSWESWMVVAWFAVQESWRHALLVYLYMAVCGVSSDDPRVQSSVRQIFRVIATVKKHASADTTVPFFIQYLMASSASYIPN